MTKENIFFITLLLFLCFVGTTKSYAVSEITTRMSTPHQETPASSPVDKECGSVCNCDCQSRIESNHVEIRNHTTSEFVKHRQWMVDVFWKDHILPAMGMMASQITTGAMQQVFIIGGFFDAKHQLETQRLFQQLMAEAHRDYMPSEGICEVGSAVRSLAASERLIPLAQTLISERNMDRQLGSKDTVSGADFDSDIKSRFKNFTDNFCNENDNAEGLKWLCQEGGQNSSPSTNSSTNNNSASNNTAGSSGGTNNTTNASANNNPTNNSTPNVSLAVGGNSGSEVPLFEVSGQFPAGGDGANIRDYRTIILNVGNDFNNGLGRFTAPEDGTYNFTANVIIRSDQPGIVYLRRNNINITEGRGSNTEVQNIRISFTTELERGDRVDLFTEERLASGNHRWEGSFTQSSGGSGDINTADGSNSGVGDSGNNTNATNGGSGADNNAGGSNDRSEKENVNSDIDFTRSVLSKPTIDADLTTDPATAPEELFAMAANLFGHQPLAFAPNITMADQDGQPKAEALRYLDLRSIVAKRSIAQNSFAAITAERVSGDTESAPYIKKIIEELGIAPNEINDLLGEKPSYYAQMEVLTKRVAQNPTFYTELYDKPTNVLRKQAMLRAINLMQERDLYKSQLRQEMALAVALETMLHDDQIRVKNLLDQLEQGGSAAFNE